MAIDQSSAREVLTQAFAAAEEDFRSNAAAAIPPPVLAAIKRMFESVTQAYREALVGCAVVRLVDPTVDIRYPSEDPDKKWFSGRTIGEKVITPFLQEKRVPVSGSPYLSSLRGGAKFIPGGQPRVQRDQAGFEALVEAADYLAGAQPGEARGLLRRLLFEFIQLRESADIKLMKTGRPSQLQLDRIVCHLLDLKSGGRIASYLTIAMFKSLSDRFDLKWDVEFQGINVADKFTGAVGDVTVMENGSIILGIEITERAIAKARVSQVFENKISSSELTDYLFVTTASPEDGALEVARNYTAAGNEINFVDLRNWLQQLLSTVGPKGRLYFQDRLIEQLSQVGVPVELKIGWNDAVNAAIAGR